MNDSEALSFLREYFAALFIRHDLEVIDTYMAPDYFDDDIGDPNVNHLQCSKDFLADLFMRMPGIGVEVKSACCRDDVISAYLNWTLDENGQHRVIKKGVAIFVLRDRQIIKRHTFLYYSEE